MAATLQQMQARFHAAVDGSAPRATTADRLCLACVDVLDVDGAAISVVFEGASRSTLGASSQLSRRIDGYQFTFGEGPCLEAVDNSTTVVVPDLDSPTEGRWPVYAGAVLGEGIRAFFALPVTVSSGAIGALGLFRRTPGPLREFDLTGGRMAAQLASIPLLDLVRRLREDEATDDERRDDHPERIDQARACGMGGLDRIEVYQATGMLIAQLGVEPDEAMVRLRGHAMATGQTASEVAWDILHRQLVIPRDDDRPEGRTRR